jgi:hypothetical protein
MRVDSNGLLTKLDDTPLGAEDADTTPVGTSPDSISVVGALETVE